MPHEADSGRIGLYGSGMSALSQSKNRRPACARGRYPKRIPPVLLVCAAAIIFVSAIAVAPIGKGQDGAAQLQAPGIAAAPPPPYFVIGYTYDAGGVALPNCSVNITDLRTGAYCNTLASDANGFYQYDLNTITGGWTVGDMINVTAQKDLAIGWNESAATSGPYLRMDVTLGTVIPEFPTVIVPVAGMLVLIAAVGFRRRGK